MAVWSGIHSIGVTCVLKKRNIGCKRNKEFFFLRHGEIFPQLKLLEAKFKLSSYLKQTKSIGIAHA